MLKNLKEEARDWILSMPAHACSICKTSQGTLIIGSTKSARFAARCQQHILGHPAMLKQYGMVGGFNEDQVWFLNNPGQTTRYRLSKANEVVEGIPILVRLENNNCSRRIVMSEVIDKDAPDHVLAQIYDCYCRGSAA